MRYRESNAALPTSWFVASVLLAFFIAPTPVLAEDLGSITTVDYAGTSIGHLGTVTKSSLQSETQYWTINFAWPEFVSFGTGRTFVGIFRGTFGNLDAGTLQSGVNYAYQKTSFASGMQSFGANYALPSLLNPQTPSGTYTILVAEYPFSNYSDATVLDWFARGGVSGTKEPYRYTTLTFTYNAVETPTELENAIQSVTYAGKSIVEGDTVYRREINPSEDQYWDFVFNWPNSVSNEKALLMVFRGTFGNIDGGALNKGVNYNYNFQAWPSGVNDFGKFMDLPLLRASTTPPGVYTLMVAERSSSSLSQSPDRQALWFASGGVQGIGPSKYALLTFNYKKYADCCSSVAFIPGLKGSRLAIGSDTIWPPSAFSNDIPQLALTPDAQSVNDVRVTGVLDSFYGVPIYSGFENYLTTLKGTVIHDWKSLPYDWRYAPQTIVSRGVSTPTGVSYMQNVVEKLAEDSDTGKVHIVAHSYGGLVGKELIRELESVGEAGLVDSFVMVGSPQLGTPQAIASLLHGDGESIFGGVIVNKAASRQVAQNMPSTYMLLPSAAYFGKVADPVITFNPSASFTLDWRTYWGPGISSFLDLFAFTTGGSVTRTKPQLFETQKPEILNPTIFTDAANAHTVLDGMTISSNIRVVQIAGWGLPTVKSVEYRNEHFLQSYRTDITVEGDGTVVYPSAISTNGNVLYFNLDLYSSLGFRKSEHKDMLNTESVQSILSQIFENKNQISESQFITYSKPNLTSLDKKLTVSTHSPVVLGAYDQSGRFTGVDQNQDLNSEFLRVVQDIPGSSFINTVESQYLFLPNTGSYTFVYKGTGTGSTTVEVGTLVNDIATTTATFTDIPTTSNTSAAFTVNAASPASTTISVDTDGDQQPDLVVDPDTQDLTLSEVVTLLKQKVQALQTKEALKKNLLKRIDNLEKKIAKQRVKKASKIVMNLQATVLKKAQKGRISDTEAAELINLLELIETKI